MWPTESAGYGVVSIPKHNCAGTWHSSWTKSELKVKELKTISSYSLNKFARAGADLVLECYTAKAQQL